MEISNTRIVPAPPHAVWNALSDPAMLKDCLPGCESIEKAGEGEWQVVMVARVGPVSARFNGRMTMSDVVVPTSYTLTYVARAQVGGKLAQIGSRLIDGVAARMTDDFFGRFVERLRPAAPAGAGTQAAAAPGGTGVATAGGSPWIRYAAIAVIVIVSVILYLLYLRGRA